MQNRKIIFKSDSRYYFCDIRGGKLVKKVSVSKEAAELIIELYKTITFVESERGASNVKQN
jgi:hypothetical protein